MSNSALSYLKNFSKDKYVASVVPTSKYGVHRVCEKIDFRRCQLIVEYGPATGVFTSFLLDHLSPKGRLILIERNQDFVATLQKSFQDNRVAIYNESAENILELLKDSGDQADYIISGIPFSLFPKGLRQEIVQKTFAALRPGGKFLAYQTFYQRDSHLKNILDQYFTTVNVQYELFNIPPMRIYEAIK